MFFLTPFLLFNIFKISTLKVYRQFKECPMFILKDLLVNKEDPMFNVESPMVNNEYPMFFGRLYGCQSRSRDQKRKSNGRSKNTSDKYEK